MISEDKILYDKLKHNKTERINSILSDKDVNSPYYNLCQAEINFQWALASIKFKDYFAAANEVNKAYKLLTLNNKLYPAFYPNLKYLGLLHILIGSVPDDYQWILKILKFRGKLSEGIKEMERLSQLSKTNPAYHHLFIENSVYLSYIYINFNNEKEKLNQLEETVFKDSLFKPLLKTPLIAYCRANIAVNTGHNDFAIKILSELNYKNINFFPFYYLDYFKGLVKLNRLDRDADVYLLNFLNNYKGKNYLKAACQKLAWFYLINDDKEGYLENINKIGVLGENNVDEDKQAYREYLSK
ncbi:MAG: hypothetical protein KA792_09700, partial [Bacteroidales bacterium]|nr:hypothetical protein [Bacteroidales bacterium]